MEKSYSDFTRKLMMKERITPATLARRDIGIACLGSGVTIRRFLFRTETAEGYRHNLPRINSSR
jgi:hypothetical protein